MALPDDIVRFVDAVGPDHDEIQREMADRAAEQNFPIVGSDAGGVLRLLARLTDARDVFEFGSGFGYSAYWFARGMDGGRVVLTERDAPDLDVAREFFGRADLPVTAEFEAGDALDVIERYDGPFDVVLVDHQKERYVEAFEAVRPKVPVGGVVVADNVMWGPVDFDAIRRFLEGGKTPDAARSRGVAEYLAAVRDDPGFETVALPVGEGLAVSYRVE